MSVPLQPVGETSKFGDDSKVHDGLEGQNTTIDAVEDQTAKEALEATEQFTPEEYKKLVRKIDLILLPLMFWCYGIQQTDKLGLNTLNLFGLQKDTGMVGNQYSLLNVMFYVAYAIFEFPCMALLQRYNVGKGLTIYIFLWGVVVFVQSFFTTWAQFATFRFLQGIFECTVSPGFTFIIAQWYTTREHASRSLVFASANGGWGTIVQLTFYGIAKHVDKHPGKWSSWRYMEIFLGAQTLLAAVFAWFILGTPNEVRWLTPREKLMATTRVMANHAGTDTTGKKHYDWGQVREAFMDPVLYFSFLNTFLATVPNGALTTFGGVLNKSFGFDEYEVTLLAAPRDVWSVLWFIMVGLCTSRWKNTRMWWMIISIIVPIASFLVIALLPPDTSYRVPKYIMYMVTTSYTIPTFLGWSLLSSNIAGKTKYTVVSSLTFIAYCAGSLTGTQIMRPDTAPRYIPGSIIAACIMSAGCVLIVVWRIWLMRENRRKRRAIEAEGISPEEVEKRARELGAQDVTDRKNPYFFYAM